MSEVPLYTPPPVELKADPAAGAPGGGSLALSLTPSRSRTHTLSLAHTLSPSHAGTAGGGVLPGGNGSMVLWCFVLNPHRGSPYSKFLFCITR